MHDIEHDIERMTKLIREYHKFLKYIDNSGNDDDRHEWQDKFPNCCNIAREMASLVITEL